MSLFGAKSAQPSLDVDALRNEVQHLRDAARIRQKYSTSLTDEEVTDILDREKREAEEKRDREEFEAADHAKQMERKKAIEALAVKCVEDGRILIGVGNTRVKSIPSNLSVKCPHCGGEIQESWQPIFTYAEKLYSCPESAKFTNADLIVHSASNPLSAYCGGHLYKGYLTCYKCNKGSHFAVQVIMVPP